MIDSKKIIAHRGAWKDFNLPQNSIAAFNKAQELPIGGIEFDLQLTKDEKVIVFHDDEINGKSINSLMYHDLKEVLLLNGESIPLLSDFIKEWNESHLLWIELKENQLSEAQKQVFVNNVLYDLRNITENIHFISFDFSILKNLCEHSAFHCSYLNDDCMPKKLFDQSIKGLNAYYERYFEDTSLLFQLKRLKMTSSAWTINDVDIAQELNDLEIDYITTDELLAFLI